MRWGWSKGFNVNNKYTFLMIIFKCHVNLNS